MIPLERLTGRTEMPVDSGKLKFFLSRSRDGVVPKQSSPFKHNVPQLIDIIERRVKFLFNASASRMTLSHFRERMACIRVMKFLELARGR